MCNIHLLNQLPFNKDSCMFICTSVTFSCVFPADLPVCRGLTTSRRCLPRPLDLPAVKSCRKSVGIHSWLVFFSAHHCCS